MDRWESDAWRAMLTLKAQLFPPPTARLLDALGLMATRGDRILQHHPRGLARKLSHLQTDRHLHEWIAYEATPKDLLTLNWVLTKFPESTRSRENFAEMLDRLMTAGPLDRNLNLCRIALDLWTADVERRR